MTVPAPGVGHYAAPDRNDGTDGAFCGGAMTFLSGGLTIFSGTGAPGANVNGGDTPLVGDLYLRADGGVGTTVYRCQSLGPVVWAGIL
jgi:hypothetical protein